MRYDQAHMLRRKLLVKYGGKQPSQVIAVTSGKGGAGKSNFALNFALAMHRRGHAVLIVDADMGMANIDVLIGESPAYTMYDVLHGAQPLEAIIHETNDGVALIAGGSGLTELLFIEQNDLVRISGQLQHIMDGFDYIILDTGAGLSKQTLHFIAAADHTIVVTTPEPPAIADAYAMIKAVHALEPATVFSLVVNRIHTRSEGHLTADKIRFVSKRFLHVDIRSLGFLPDDEHVSRAVKQQVPFLTRYPDSIASRHMIDIAARYELLKGPAKQRIEPASEKRTVARFVSRVIGLWK
jgi:flagellar biosynthesis protein FlhG